MPPLDDEIRYRLLNLLEKNPQLSQRELAQALGVSLGKVNYCLRALISRGWIKIKNFARNPSKRAYAYYLTPKGIEEKGRVTARFLKKKIDEYQVLKKEIEYLKQELDKQRANNGREIT